MKSTRLALVVVALSGCVTAPPSHDEMLADLDTAKSQLAARQDAVELTGSLHDYIAAALRDQPELTASYQRWRAAALKVDAVGTWPEPMVSYSYFLRSVETRVGPQRHKIGLTQPIPWPSKLSTGKRVASAAAKGEEAKYEAQMLMTRMRISQIFWRAWLVAQVRHWREQQVSLLEAMSASLRARLETGRAQLSDLNQVELRISRIRDMLIGMDETELQLKAILLAEAGAPLESVAPISDVAPTVPAAEPDEDALISAALEHPRVHAALAMQEMSEMRAKRAGLDALPDFSVGVNYIETGASAMSPAPADNGKDPIVAMVGVKIPLWFGDYAAGRDSEEAQALASAATAESIRHELAGAVRAELSRLRDARRRLQLYKDVLIPQAEAAYRSVLSSYETGGAQIAAALLAQRELIELNIGIAEALADIGRSQATIEQLTAQPL